MSDKSCISSKGPRLQTIVRCEDYFNCWRDGKLLETNKCGFETNSKHEDKPLPLRDNMPIPPA